MFGVHYNSRFSYFSLILFSLIFFLSFVFNSHSPELHSDNLYSLSAIEQVMQSDQYGIT